MNISISRITTVNECWISLLYCGLFLRRLRMCWQQNLLSQLSCGSLSIWFFSLQAVSMTLFVSLLLVAVCTVSSAWDLSPLGLDSALISHVTLCGTRAIINIPRQDVHQPYSLLEASWPERPKPFFSFVRPYPSREPQVWKLLDERMLCLIKTELQNV